MEFSENLKAEEKLNKHEISITMKRLSELKIEF